MKYELTDSEWKALKRILPERTGKQGRPCRDLRRTLSGIKWILKTGSSWRALPYDFGKWNSVYRYFCRIQANGVFEKVFEDLTKGADSQEVSVDSTFIKVHRQGLGVKKSYLIPSSTNT